jgi:hypothetical protein
VHMTQKKNLMQQLQAHQKGIVSLTRKSNPTIHMRCQLRVSVIYCRHKQGDRDVQIYVYAALG